MTFSKYCTVIVTLYLLLFEGVMYIPSATHPAVGQLQWLSLSLDSLVGLSWLFMFSSGR